MTLGQKKPIKSLHTVGGREQNPKQQNLKGKSVTHEEFPTDTTDPLGEPFMDGDLIAIDDIINEVVNVTDFEQREGLYGDYITVRLEDDRIFNIGSPAVIERMNNVYEQLPMQVVFVKKELAGNKRMYSVITKDTFLRMGQSGEMK